MIPFPRRRGSKDDEMNPTLYQEMARIQQEHWWFKARRQILQNLITSFALPDNARILEIGCGTGGNLAMLAQFGRMYGLELDDYARAHASKVSGLDIKAGDLPDNIPYDDQQFDAVCLFDVLEHVEDDTAGLLRVARLVKPGGKIFITVPAYQWLYGTHDREHQHFRRYTARGLRLKSEIAGLRVLRLGYFNTLLFPLVALSRGMERWLGSEQSYGASLPPAWLNAMLYRVFCAEWLYLRLVLFPFGTSVMGVLERRQ